MRDIWGEFKKVHAIILDPYNRVGVLKSVDQQEWSASLTRAIINKNAEHIIKTSFNAIFDIDYADYTVHKLWHTTIDELSYDMFVIDMSPGVTFSIYKHMMLEFLSPDDVMGEILEDLRVYTDDTIRVFTHLSTYITHEDIGEFKFKEVI